MANTTAHVTLMSKFKGNEIAGVLATIFATQYVKISSSNHVMPVSFHWIADSQIENEYISWAQYLVELELMHSKAQTS